MAERMYILGLDSEDGFEERTLALVGVTNIDESPGRMYIPGLDSDDS